MTVLVLIAPDGALRVGGAVRDPAGRWRADPMPPPEGGWIRFAPLPDGAAALALRGGPRGVERLRVTVEGIREAVPVRGLPAGWIPPAEIRAVGDGWIRAGSVRISPDGEAVDDPCLLDPGAVLLPGGVVASPWGVLFHPGPGSERWVERAPWAGAGDHPRRILAADRDRAVLLVDSPDPALVLAGQEGPVWIRPVWQVRKGQAHLRLARPIQAGAGDETGRWILAVGGQVWMGSWGKIHGRVALPPEAWVIRLQTLPGGGVVAFRRRGEGVRAALLAAEGRIREELPLLAPWGVPMGGWTLFPSDPIRSDPRSDPGEWLPPTFAPALLSPEGRLEELGRAGPVEWAAAPWGGAVMEQGEPSRLRVLPAGRERTVPGRVGLLRALPDGRIAVLGKGILLLVTAEGERTVPLPAGWRPRAKGWAAPLRDCSVLPGEPFDLLVLPGEDRIVPIRLVGGKP